MIITRVLYGYLSVHGAVFRSRKSYGTVRCGFKNRKYYGAVRCCFQISWILLAVRCGACCYLSYGAFRCVFQKSEVLMCGLQKSGILRCGSVRSSGIANPTVRFGAVRCGFHKSEILRWASARSLERFFVQCGSTPRKKNRATPTFSTVKPRFRTVRTPFLYKTAVSYGSHAFSLRVPYK